MTYIEDILSWVKNRLFYSILTTLEYRPYQTVQSPPKQILIGNPQPFSTTDRTAYSSALLSQLHKGFPLLINLVLGPLVPLNKA